MNFNRILFFILSIAFLSSCIKDTDPKAPSTDASFVKLTFATNSYLRTAVFEVVPGNGIDTIMNIDSLAYGTNINALVPTLSFKSSSAVIIIYPPANNKPEKKDTVYFNGKDTINFSRMPLLRNIAADKVTTKEYILKINVHVIEPELYVWQKVGDQLLPENAISQKTIIRNDSIFHYYTDGIQYGLKTSNDGKNWDTKTVTGIPPTNNLNDLTLYNGKMYFTQDGFNIYSSNDGFNWVKKSVSEFEFTSLLFEFKSQMWAVVKLIADNSYRFATSTDGDIWATTNYAIPTDFPVKDFASLSFSTRNGVPKVLVLGGVNWNNEYKRTNWSSEDGRYWINFTSAISSGQHMLDTLDLGTSIISYDKKLLLFGYTDKPETKNRNHYRHSVDEGLTWQVPTYRLNGLHEKEFKADTIKRNDTIIRIDTTYHVVYKPRKLQSVVVNSKKEIFIVGGKVGSETQTDVWKGKLNRFYFIKQ